MTLIQGVGHLKNYCLKFGIHYNDEVNLSSLDINVLPDPESLTLALDDDETLAGTSSEEPLSLSAQGKLPREQFHRGIAVRIEI